MSISFFIFTSLPFRLLVAKLVKFKSFRLSVYRNASQNEDPYYNEYLFAAQNQTRSKGINTTDALYSVGMAGNKRKCSLEVAETDSVVVEIHKLFTLLGRRISARRARKCK